MLIVRAEIAVLTHEYDKALADCDAALVLDNRKSRAYFIRGVIQQERNLTSEAIESFSSAIMADNNNASAYVERGRCYAQLLHHPEAVHDFTRAIELCPDLKGLYAARAESLFYLREPDPALADCEASLREDPNSAAPYAIRGVILAGRGEYEAGLKDLNHAIALGVPNENCIFYYYYRGIVRLTLGMPKEAVADLEHCCTQNAECYPCHYALAAILSIHPDANVRDGAKAIEHATKAITLYQHSSGPKEDMHLYLEMMASAHAELGIYDEAISFQSLALNSSPPEWRDSAVERLELYEAGQPYRETATLDASQQSLVGNWPQP